MANILSSNIRFKNIQNFLNTITNESVYFGFSNPTVWTDENSPTVPKNTQAINNDIFGDILFLKRILASNSSNVAKNYGWTSGSRYSQYDDNVDTDDLTRVRTYIPATATANLTGGTVTSATITNTGAEYTSTPTVTFSAPSAGVTATGVAVIQDGYLSSITITNVGSGYGSTAPTITIGVPSTISSSVFDLRPYYAMTDNMDVYICLDNNNGAQSTTKPTSQSTVGNAVSYLADGYCWKYLFTLSTLSTERFLTSNWIPVTTLAIDDGSNQFQVQSNAVDGAIYRVETTSGGTGYTNGASQAATVTGGDGSGFAATALVSGGIVGKITVTNPGSGYTIAPTLSFVGYSNGSFRPILTPKFGLGSDPIKQLNATNLMVKVRLSGDEGGQIIAENEYRQISIISNPVIKSTYYAAGATGTADTSKIKLNATHASAASDITADIYPTVGKNIIILQGPGKGQVRTISSYSNPDVTITPVWTVTPSTATSKYGFIANGTVLNQTVVLTLNVVTSGPFLNDTVATQSTSNATGRIVKYDATNKKLYLTSINGTFDGTHSVTAGSVSSTITAVTERKCEYNIGEVLYCENRKAITRNTDQIEDVKVIVQF